MDNNKRKNDFQDDLDNMWLKDHLNASFELDNIKVSEDLMDRTLKAIKEAEKDEEYQKEKKKIRRFPVGRLVSAAAVLFVLLVGIGVMQLGFTGSKKSESDMSMDMVAGEAENSAMADITMEQAASSEKSAESSVDMYNDSSTTYSMAEDSSEKYDLAAVEDSVDGETNEIMGKTFGTDINNSGDQVVNSDICPVSADSVTALIITKKDGEEVKSQNPVESATTIYDMLSGYPLELVEESSDNNDWMYKITITSTDNLEYTYLIGENIQVLNENEKEKNSAGYHTEDMKRLLEEMDHYYKELKNEANK